MTRLLLIGFASVASAAALAHNSVVPHTHPHETSVLPDISIMLLAAIVVGCGVIAFRKLKGR